MENTNRRSAIRGLLAGLPLLLAACGEGDERMPWGSIGRGKMPWDSVGPKFTRPESFSLVVVIPARVEEKRGSGVERRALVEALLPVFSTSCPEQIYLASKVVIRRIDTQVEETQVTPSYAELRALMSKPLLMEVDGSQIQAKAREILAAKPLEPALEAPSAPAPPGLPRAVEDALAQGPVVMLGTSLDKRVRTASVETLTQVTGEALCSASGGQTPKSLTVILMPAIRPSPTSSADPPAAPALSAVAPAASVVMPALPVSALPPAAPAPAAPAPAAPQAVKNKRSEQASEVVLTPPTGGFLLQNGKAASAQQVRQYVSAGADSRLQGNPLPGQSPVQPPPAGARHQAP
jgi:hypothetical protein